MAKSDSSDLFEWLGTTVEQAALCSRLTCSSLVVLLHPRRPSCPFVCTLLRPCQQSLQDLPSFASKALRVNFTPLQTTLDRIPSTPSFATRPSKQHCRISTHILRSQFSLVYTHLAGCLIVAPSARPLSLRLDTSVISCGQPE